MNSTRSSDATEASDQLDCFVVGVVVSAVGFAVAAYGGVEPWSESVLAIFTIILAALSCIQIGRGRGSKALWLPVGILVVFAGYIALQATPLPVSVVRLLSPSRLVADASALEGESDSVAFVCYYHLATTHGLRLFLLGLSVFCATCLSVQARPQLKLLLAALFVVGSAEAALALLQLGTNAGGIYWSEGGGGIRSGSFINHSNFAQFINLTAGAGLGWLLIRLSEMRHRKRVKGEQEASSKLVFEYNWFLFLGLATHAIAIAASLSRAGLVGMIAGTFVVALLLGRQKGLGWRSWALFALPPLAFAGSVLFGFDAIYERLGTLEEKETYADRWELGAASLRAASEHLWFGAGLDNYQYVFPQHDTTGVVYLAEQADNDYVQLLVEMGVLGTALVFAFLVAVGVIILRRIRSEQGHSRYALYGIAYALIAIAVQCVSDFGQRLPAVFCVTAALCGVCFSMRDKAVRSPSKIRWVGAGCLLIALSPLAGWLLNESWKDYQAERWFALAYDLEQRLADRDAEPNLQDYVDRVVAAEKAVKIRPGNLHYSFWLNTYRWQFVVAASGGDEQTFAESAEGQETTLLIADEFAKTRRLCPVFGPAYTVEGELRLLAGDERGAALVVRGAELNPNNGTAVLAAMRMQAASEDADYQELKTRLFEWAALNRHRYHGVATILVNEMNRPDWARELAGEDPDRLSTLLRVLQRAGVESELTAGLAQQVELIQQERVLEGAASPSEYANAAAKHAKDGQHGLAVELYLKALAKNYSNQQWRLALADALAALERFDEAERHARIALRLSPSNAAARRKLEEISLLIPAEGESAPTP